MILANTSLDVLLEYLLVSKQCILFFYIYFQSVDIYIDTYTLATLNFELFHKLLKRR